MYSSFSYYICTFIVIVSSESAKENTVLMKNVRRQLMEDNYDYNPTESEEDIPFKITDDIYGYYLTATTYKDPNPVTSNYHVYQRAAEANYIPSFEIIRINNSPYIRNPDFSLRLGIDDRKDINNKEASLYLTNDKPDLEVLKDVTPSKENIYKKLTKINAKPAQATTKLDQRVKKHDLLYYMDDSMLVPTKKTTKTVEDIPAVKYKLLRMNDPSRRSNNLRHFVQAEDSKGGMFIFNVDAGPFPEFRLPANRRQYMQDDNAQEVQIKSKEFVNEIKQSLRRDNDDYIDRASLTTILSPEPTSSNSSFLPTSSDLINYTTQYIQEASINDKDLKRRANDVSLQNDLDINSKSFEHSSIEDLLAKSSSINRKLVNKTLINNVKSNKKKGFRKTNSNKVKKNKNQPKTILHTTSSLLTTMKKMTIKISNGTTNNFDLWEFLTETGKSAIRSKAIGRTAELPAAAPSTPYPQLLDLAPARGERISSLRFKGSLCERQVLMPEGPKYDSHGRVYVASVVKRSQGGALTTPKPYLRLPICCNCCKKSVLGCE